jgi:hypothetical protein
MTTSSKQLSHLFKKEEAVSDVEDATNPGPVVIARAAQRVRDRRADKTVLGTNETAHRVSHVQTQLGDVLILATEQSFTIHAVGRVDRNGQQDFRNRMNIRYTVDRTTAILDAKNMVASGRRIFFRNLDTGTWIEILISRESQRR